MSSQENYSEKTDSAIERPLKRESPIFNHFQATVREMFKKEAESSSEITETEQGEPTIESGKESGEEIPTSEKPSDAAIEVKLKQIRNELDIPEREDESLKVEEVMLRKYTEDFDWKRQGKRYHDLSQEENTELLVAYCKQSILKKIIGLKMSYRGIYKDDIISKLKDGKVDETIVLDENTTFESGLETAWDQVIADLPGIIVVSPEKEAEEREELKHDQIKKWNEREQEEIDRNEFLEKKYAEMSKEELSTTYKKLLSENFEQAYKEGKTFEEINLMPVPENEEIKFVTERLLETENNGDYFNDLQDQAVNELTLKYQDDQNRKREFEKVEKELPSKESIIKNDLSYQDSNIPEATKEAMLEWSRNSESAARYAESLMSLSNIRDMAEIRNEARHLLDDFMEAARKLDLPISSNGKSISWAMWDIAKQYYYFTHKEEADPNYERADPLESKEKQQEIVDRHLGWEAYQAFKVNEEWKNRIENDQNFRSALELLNKNPKADGQLSSSDLAELGLRLREGK